MTDRLGNRVTSISVGLVLVLVLGLPVVRAQDRDTSSREPPSPASRASSRAFSRDLIGRENTRLRLSGERIRIDYTASATTSEDYARFDNLPEGAVATFTRGAAIKLRTGIDLTFRDVTVTTDNVAPDYPGVYGVWLRKQRGGWELSLTDEPDVWGTQYDAAAEVLVIPLAHDELSSGIVDHLAVELTETDETSGQVEIRWGTHRWIAPFRVAP